MRCSQVATWLQLYLDDRLHISRLAKLEAHLRECPRCHSDLATLEEIRATLAERESVAEPPNLERVILARIAAYEAARFTAAESANAAAGWRERRWQVAALVALVAIIYWLLPSATQANLALTFSRGLPGIVGALTAPGPNSVAWAAWAVGALAVLVLAVRFARADVSAGLRRSIAQRLPQLW
jgi:anti-sigma factor RsiW